MHALSSSPRGMTTRNTRLRAVLNWQPAVSLEEGLARTYAWIEQQLIAAGRISMRPAVLVAGR